MAILMGTGLVYKEIDKKTIYTLLAKPSTGPSSSWESTWAWS